MITNANTYKLLIFTTLLAFSLCHFVEYSSDISKDDTYKLKWAISEETSQIRIELDVKTTGWIGFGLSSKGQMADSDVYLCYVKKDGTAIVQDGYASGRYRPKLDVELGGTSDVTEVKGSIVNGRTQISFTRKLDTGDKNDFLIKIGLAMNVIFSYRLQGNPETEGDFLIHSAYYSKELYLYPRANQDINVINLTELYKDDPDIYYHDLKIPRTEIPLLDTQYYCKMFDINKMISTQLRTSNYGATYHAIGFEPLVDNEKVLHHMVVYNCNYKNVDYSDSKFECFNLHPDCNMITVTWGAGQKAYNYPEEAGLIWGTNESHFVVLEMHYTNSGLLKNQFDNSGMRIFYTPKIRKYDIGTMGFGGVVLGLRLPPGKKSVQHTTFCPADCSQKVMHPDGVKVVSFLLHGHLILKKIRAVLTLPDGTVDDTTFRDDNYDFIHQEMVVLKTPFIIKPGTSIKAICDYDTSERDSYTVGGIKSSDEMCVIGLNYYPSENGMSSCQQAAEVYVKPDTPFDDLINKDRCEPGQKFTHKSFFAENGKILASGNWLSVKVLMIVIMIVALYI